MYHIYLNSFEENSKGENYNVKFKEVFVYDTSIFWSFSTTAEATEIDSIAACAGVVVGNGAVDFSMGDEEAFDVAADIAYTAYLSIVFEGQFSQDDLQIADQILAVNLDKIICCLQ